MNAKACPTNNRFYDFIATCYEYSVHFITIIRQDAFRRDEIHQAHDAKQERYLFCNLHARHINTNSPTVAGGQLAIFSKDPPTGYFRDGYCRTSSEDPGNHSIAAKVTDGFLDFTTSKGNNLKEAGVKPGMNWCLCASRWQEAYDAYKSGNLQKSDVPQVFLHASHEAALKTVSYKTLKEFEHDREAPSQENRQMSHINPSGGRNAAVREA